MPKPPKNQRLKSPKSPKQKPPKNQRLKSPKKPTLKPPKDPKLRQRRNRVSTSATLIDTARRRKYAPRLPDRGPEQPWHKLTRAWWRDVWHSPMAEEFLEADRHALYRLAVLVDLFWREPSKELGAEIRLEQQAFGLTPIDRRRLQWTVEREEERRRPHLAPEHQQADDEDPRKLLKMVASK